MHDQTYQLQYFRALTQLKDQVEYLKLYVERDTAFEFWKNLIVGITSSGAIATWALWRELPFLWASIIGAGHVVQAVSVFFPHKGRAQATARAYNGLHSVYIDAEEEWFHVAEGRITDEEINTRRAELLRRIQKCTAEFFGEIVLPGSLKLEKKACAVREQYFKNQFPLKGNSNDQ